MKKLTISIFLMTFHLLLIGQNYVNIKWPFDSNNVSAYFYESYSLKLYVGIENKFRISIPNEKTRNLILVVNDTQNLDFKIIWRPIVQGKEWYDALSEYTLATAQNRGAYNPNEINDSKKYIDTNEIYWEKEFSISPKIATEINLTLYRYLNDSTLNLYNSFKFYSNYLSEPTLIIPSFEYLIKNEILEPSFNSDLKKGNEWYKIRKFTFSAYDKRNKMIFTQTCYGNILTYQIFKFINKNKFKYVKLTNIESTKYIYDNIELFKEK